MVHIRQGLHEGIVLGRDPPARSRIQTLQRLQGRRNGLRNSGRRRTRRNGLRKAARPQMAPAMRGRYKVNPGAQSTAARTYQQLHILAIDKSSQRINKSTCLNLAQNHAPQCDSTQKAP